MQTDKCGRRGVGLPEWSCCHIVILPCCCCVGVSWGRIYHRPDSARERDGTEQNPAELKDRRSDLPCSNYMPCVGE